MAAHAGACGRSFETPRKRATPLAITAKPLRGDDGGNAVIARPFAVRSVEPGRNSGLLCSFCADAPLRSQSQESLDRSALLKTHPGGFSAQTGLAPMKKRLSTPLLWLLGLLLLFAGANFNDPYLIMLRRIGSVGVLATCLIVVA